MEGVKMAVNVYDELKNALVQVNSILEQGTDIIKPAVHALAAVVPQINELLDKVLDLLGRLKVEINKLDVSAIPVDKVLPFLDGLASLLETSRNVLPADSKDTIDTASSVINVIKTIPTPEQIKAEVVGLLDSVSGHITALKG
jgi:hypothetical protein